MPLFGGWSAKKSWNGRSEWRERVWGYLKDPPKAGSRWEKRTKTGWIGFHQGVLGSLIYSAGDSTGLKIGWAGPKSGWTGFQKISAHDFSDSFWLSDWQDRGGRGSSPETGWTGFRSGWTGFWNWRASFDKSEVNQGGTFVGSKSGFSKGIHDLEKFSLGWFEGIWIELIA
jgi:hypothetical protein